LAPPASVAVWRRDPALVIPRAAGRGPYLRQRSRGRRVAHTLLLFFPVRCASSSPPSQAPGDPDRTSLTAPPPSPPPRPCRPAPQPAQPAMSPKSFLLLAVLAAALFARCAGTPRRRRAAARCCPRLARFAHRLGPLLRGNARLLALLWPPPPPSFGRPHRPPLAALTALTALTAHSTSSPPPPAAPTPRARPRSSTPASARPRATAPRATTSSASRAPAPARTRARCTTSPRPPPTPARSRTFAPTPYSRSVSTPRAR
jgi:hypothetical protein